MRFINLVFLVSILFLGSSSILTRSEANQSLKEIEAIGETNDPALLDKKAILSNDLAVFYQSIQDNEQAIVYLEQAIEFTLKRITIEDDWNTQNLRDMQDLHLNLTKIQAAAGYLDQAQQSFLKAESYFKRLRPLLPDSSYYTIANSVYITALTHYFHAGKYDLALNYGQQCLLYAKASKEPYLIAQTYRLLGEIRSAEGDLTAAQNYFDAAWSAYEKGEPETSLHLHLVHSKIGNLYKQKNYEAVIRFMENDRVFANQHTFKELAKDISVSEYLHLLNSAFVLSYAHIRYYQETGIAAHLVTAQEWQNLAYSFAEHSILENGVDRLGQVIQSPQKKITSTLKNYELLDKESGLSQKEIGQLLRTIDVYHSTQLHFNRLKNEIIGQDWQRQKNLRADLKRIFQQIKEANKEDAFVDSLQLQSKEITEEINALAVSTKRQKIAKEYQLGQARFMRHLRQYSEKNHKTVVSYFWSEPLSSVYIIGQNPEKSFFKAVPVSSDFMEMVNTSYQLNSHFIKNASSLHLQDSLNRALYKILIAPIRSEISTKNLLVCPIGPISYVSFDALRTDKNRYLIERLNTSYTSSLFALLRNKKHNPANEPQKVMAFQPRNYGDDSLSALYHARQEIATLDSFFPTIIYRGNDATKKQFLKQSKAARIVHVASHSILDPENPYESYLIFEEKDGTNSHQLKASEIFANSFSSDLVVLSSCNSAKGKFSGDIGIVSLSNAFYFSGVPSTVGSLWSAQDKSSSEIMCRFYEYLFQRKKKSVSLTNAKRNYLKHADAIKQQPFFWANYVVYGDDSQIVLEQEKSDFTWIVWWALGAGLLLYVAYKFFRTSRASL